MVENKVYNGWGTIEAGQSNYETRNELKRKYKILCCDNRQPTKEELENNDIVSIYLGGNCLHREYQVLKRPAGLNNDEIALILDGDLLIDGYAVENNLFYIYQD